MQFVETTCSKTELSTKMHRNFQGMVSFGLATALFLVFCAGPVSSATLSSNRTGSTRQSQCRVSGGQYLDPERFALYSCAMCYRHMDGRLFSNGTRLEQRGLWLFDPRTREAYLPTFENTSSPIFRTFRTPKQVQLWVGCCRAAVQCCNEQMRKTPLPEDTEMCPQTWDGWNCWTDAAPGTLQTAPCPSYVYFHSDEPQCTRYTTKRCWDNSTWLRNFKGNEYSDYTACGQGQDIKLLLKTHVITFGISIVLLAPALVIFFYYRQLRVPRIFMHKNLFVSLFLTAVFVVVFESYFIVNSINNAGSIIESNHAGCRLFYALTKYLRLTTYTWMFCEGFYLHRLIAAAFAEQKGTAIFLVIGWGVPVIPVGIWVAIRLFKADELCWTVPHSYYEWVIYFPMLLGLVVNFGFLAHIVQVIVTKLRSSHMDEPAQFKRTVRATMVLIPLFGLHFLFLSYHPYKGECHMLLIYNVITYSLDGLQGGIVSLLFCYLNHEVIFLLKRTYERKKMIRDINTQAGHLKKNSRTSVSTNFESIANEGALSQSLRKK